MKYSEDEIAFMCETMSNRKLKWTEYEELYKEGRLRVPPKTVQAILYSDEPDAWTTLATTGFKTLGAPPRVRSPFPSKLLCSPHGRAVACFPDRCIAACSREGMLWHQ